MKCYYFLQLILLNLASCVSLQELQLHCTEGQALLNTLLVSRELVIPWGLPQIEDRALETLQQEWRLYQARLADTRAQLNSALAKLRQMEQKFQRLDSWLKGMETKAQLRSHRRSDRTTKDAQLQLIKVRVTCVAAMHGKMFCTFIKWFGVGFSSVSVTVTF